MSYDIKVWRVIKKGYFPVPSKKDDDGQVIVSTDPLDLDYYTDKHAAVITVNAKAKNLMYNAINGEEYEKISSCETAKEMWDKLEVTYEGTNKVKEIRINLLVRDYELFQMKDGESVEEMFSRFSKILGDLMSLGRPIKSGEQDLDKISYDEHRGDLIAFEKTHLDRQIKQEKKKTVSFKATVAESENEEEEEGEVRDENIPMLSQVVTSMMRKHRYSRRGRSNFRKGRTSNENDKNDGRCYECEKYGHIQADCPELKRKLSRNFQKKKSFGSWSDEEESDHEEIINMYFMVTKEGSNKDSDEPELMAESKADKKEDSGELYLMADEETSEVRLYSCPNCYELQEFVHIALIDIEKVLGELRKIKSEKKDWALKLIKNNRRWVWRPKSISQANTQKSNHSGPKQAWAPKNNSTCDVDEVYLAEELGYNLLSISQLCDNDYEVRFKKYGWFIEDESDTNPHLKNDRLPENEKISIVPKSIDKSGISSEKVTNQQNQSTMSLTENQESTLIGLTNSAEKELKLVIPNE
uniref:CCHC-type domain-containing protein n=1 Tax=Nicotiana tabacum TaxID=4097 RepID=A0A1S3YG23_TOBAC|nr:PREDICTED: uncharacterized protein LOC107775804 [Nicotiana tabacum]